MEFLVSNWSEIALAAISFFGTWTGITESTKDDKIYDVLSRILNAIVFGRTKKKRKLRK
jgi:hypothetical protein|tara:strand:+ start:724 stop:900 length:177 start_codon:yes stop_codon:yes gene_type:complete